MLPWPLSPPTTRGALYISVSPHPPRALQGSPPKTSARPGWSKEGRGRGVLSARSACPPLSCCCSCSWLGGLPWARGCTPCQLASCKVSASGGHGASFGLGFYGGAVGAGIHYFYFWGWHKEDAQLPIPPTSPPPAHVPTPWVGDIIPSNGSGTARACAHLMPIVEILRHGWWAGGFLGVVTRV